MSKKIKIVLITERRADYSRFKPLLEIVKKDKQLDTAVSTFNKLMAKIKEVIDK